MRYRKQLLHRAACAGATLGLALSLAFAGKPAAAASAPGKSITSPCRIEGMPNELQCGSIQRPLNPADPAGTQISIHFLVVPAMARNKQPDPVLMLAGGPGQSAIAVAPMVMSRLARLNNRRDIVFIDQRGTGKSAPLQCADERELPFEQALDASAQLKRLETCRQDLAKLAHGDLRFYSTTIAMQDFEAVRVALGAAQWNLIGGSYGTRAGLEYLRLFPAQVRRTVLDGVAPPDMVLPASFSTDGQAALDASLRACEKEPACAQQFPQLRQQWAGLLHSMPRQLSVKHPLTGQDERFTLSRDMLLRSVRLPLYAPALASALPAAIHAAGEGRFESLMGLSGALASSKSSRLAMGMHFSVVCAEDVPRLDKAGDPPGADFGRGDAQLYTQVCKDWPRAQIADEFFSMPPATSPVLLLSGGADPATPPRHGDRAAKALAAANPKLVQHIVVPEAGHGVMGVGCMRELLFRFIDAKTDALALPQDAACASKIPRPGAFLPVQASKGQQP
ncbi:alpha/beta hydrolase [Paucibacter sp. TC2R-5]|uniref:alpha/beta hydrolase n=1 Tax=Paucibacter sp. TC2R-5 TaxID=2893555 RepID=UPI0021E46C38|nr:alpha/beta hydrolase [Paucibacter sp. TC2R-5]MCV2358501.1 alpha/beta hydrolase [Paucibacter sp. TC2R-5]